MVLCGVVCIGLAVGMFLLRKKEIWKIIKNPCKIVFLFSLLGCLAAVMDAVSPDALASLEIARNEPGEGELETEVYLSIENEEKEFPVTLTIAERSYEKQEEERLLTAAIEEIAQSFCGENASLEEIVTDPVVCETYQDGAVAADWMFSDNDVISFDGVLSGQVKKKGGQEVDALVSLSCGESEELYRFSFRVMPRDESEEERLLAAVMEEIDGQEQTKSVVQLPKRLEGKELAWRSTETVRPAELLGLGVLAAVAAAYVAREQEQEKKKKRKQRLLLSYPEFVSKLSLLLGAGMNLSGALRKMSALYQARKQKGGKAEEVYEELFCMVCEIENGMGELRAYQSFAERCDLQPYRKLVSLLTLGQRMGNRRLMEQLNEEAERVFLERKNTARRLGEEAGTKLLLPMMLMLVIVMGIVIVPAFLSIYKN